jgi:hypothetical protein
MKAEGMDVSFIIIGDAQQNAQVSTSNMKVLRLLNQSVDTMMSR